MGNEIWVPITGFEHYEVSNFGRVRNNRGHILSIRKKGRQRPQVGLFADGVRSEIAVHVLVARHFLRGFREYTKIGHRDGDEWNNHVSNLYMKSNNNLVRSNDKPRRGNRVRNVTDSLIFDNAYDAAAYVRGDASSVYKVVTGKRGTHKGCLFEPVDPDYGY